MLTDPANQLQDYLIFGEYGEVNPSISDSSTFTFLSAEKMQETFEGQAEGCFLYSRHTNPSDEHLGKALALMENTEYAHTTSSGMSAIACTILQLCDSGDEIISSRTIYGGTYALLKNFLPRFGINSHFVNITDLEAVKSKITERTKVIYCESISNPLLEIADISGLHKIAENHNLKLVVDNTFSPMMITPSKFGADITIHSLTKFINGASDCVGGAICTTKDFINQLRDVNSGAAMLIGPVMDSLRASSILKNIHTLHLRIKQHSKNAQFIAENFENLGIKVYYPGLKSHPQHELMKSMLNPGFGFGGMLTIDAKDEETANILMIKMQENVIGYFAVSLGFYKTLFSSPGTSTSSEIPKEDQQAMGMTCGLVRFSIGLDNDIERSLERIKKCMKEVGVL